MRDSSITGKERLVHILEAITEIEAFTKDSSLKSFLKNRVLINATLFQFTIIGESIIHIDNDLLDKYDYPWHKVRGLRNFILYEYHAIEFRIVWEAINSDLPELKKITQQILTSEYD
jgi:uncharacterized protein with HEPN domain